MKSLWICLALGLTASNGYGQTVQLPTFHYFTVNTTVSVPDSGAGIAAGINKSASARARMGLPGVSRLPINGRPPANSAIGGSRQAGGLQVRAEIHDFDAMEQALRDAVSNEGVAESRANIPADRQAPALSIAEIRRRQAGEQDGRNGEAANFIALGRRAAEAGKPNVAKVYFRNAAARGDGEVQQEALRLLRRLEQSPDAGQVAIYADP